MAQWHWQKVTARPGLEPGTHARTDALTNWATSSVFWYIIIIIRTKTIHNNQNNGILFIYCPLPPPSIIREIRINPTQLKLPQTVSKLFGKGWSRIPVMNNKGGAEWIRECYFVFFGQYFPANHSPYAALNISAVCHSVHCWGWTCSPQVLSPLLAAIFHPPPPPPNNVYI